jgi:glycosyltransferase involved in cell wall biosynthesis
MITIDASNTYSPGNYVLLKYLLKTLEEKGIKSEVYVIYEKIYRDLLKLNLSNTRIIKTTLFKTLIRFCKKKDNVLFFCSVPPFIKQDHSIVYFHSPYIARPIVWKNKDLSFKTKFKRYLNTLSIRFFKNKVDFFACQTPAMERDLKKTYPGIKIRQIPFFEPVKKLHGDFQKDHPKTFDFIYPATPGAHKNYFRLFEALKNINRERKTSLCVTVDFSAQKYIEKINQMNKVIGWSAIHNVGRVSKERTIEFFYKSRALFFPSLEESFGLPIAEAAQLGCPVLISDLPYAYDVISNPVTFNPLDIEDMERVMRDFLDGKYDGIQQEAILENKIDELINFFLEA